MNKWKEIPKGKVLFFFFFTFYHNMNMPFDSEWKAVKLKRLSSVTQKRERSYRFEEKWHQIATTTNFILLIYELNWKAFMINSKKDLINFILRERERESRLFFIKSFIQLTKGTTTSQVIMYMVTLSNERRKMHVQNTKEKF